MPHFRERRYQKELNALFCRRKVLDVIQRQAETTNLNEQFHSQVLSVNADFFTKTMWCPLPHPHTHTHNAHLYLAHSSPGQQMGLVWWQITLAEEYSR